MSPVDRENVTIEYGVVRVPRYGAWHPIFWVDGRPRYFFVPKGHDRDVALRIAKASAEEHAARYIGDWNVRIVEVPKDVAWEERLQLRSVGHASGRSTKLRDAQKRLARQWQGLSRHRPLKDFPRRSIERGADVEVEHVGYRPIARRIAADHLMEDRRYYQKLAKMEGRSGGRAGFYIVEGLERVSSEYSDAAAAIGVAEGYYRNNVARGRSTYLPVSVVRAHSMSEASGLAEFGEEPFARGKIVWKDGRDPRQQDLPFGRAGGRKPKGAPTDLNLFTLHKELGNHLRMFGVAEPLYRFEPTSVAGLRRLIDAGYLKPAEGRPKGYWTLTGIGTYEYELWLQRNAGRYGIPRPSNDS